ncbi:hypothetical protein H0274_01075 [Altererythrobacter sp. CC-YST694]|uniref:hypothetical protein n=1 Tax=Altererythrobacter sp. CC-YST694 TaxID=2755038 RepID=UPI001D024C60|nr:hypothetical protein [Altererythrobacter sp. CC-YST694]MCB5423834.1 hypothetical protein [Altererythrobacter sp. CC-YST694]
MESEAADMAAWLNRWHALPVGDQQGIMHRMEASQRLAFERLLAAAEREKADADARNRRFRAYSPWLAALLDACENDGRLASQLTPAVRSALLEGQEQIVSSQGRINAPRIPGEGLRSLWRELRNRL